MAGGSRSQLAIEQDAKASFLQQSWGSQFRPRSLSATSLRRATRAASKTGRRCLARLCGAEAPLAGVPGAKSQPADVKRTRSPRRSASACTLQRSCSSPQRPASSGRLPSLPLERATPSFGSEASMASGMKRRDSRIADALDPLAWQPLRLPLPPSSTGSDHRNAADSGQDCGEAEAPSDVVPVPMSPRDLEQPASPRDSEFGIADWQLGMEAMLDGQRSHHSGAFACGDSAQQLASLKAEVDFWKEKAVTTMCHAKLDTKAARRSLIFLWRTFNAWRRETVLVRTAVVKENADENP